MHVRRSLYCSKKLCFQCIGQFLPNESSNSMNSIRICNLHHVHYFPFARKSYCFGNEFLDYQWSLIFIISIVSPYQLRARIGSVKEQKIGTSKKLKYKTKYPTYFIQARVTKYGVQTLNELWVENQWLILLVISHQLEHQFSCQHLSSLPTKSQNDRKESFNSYNNELTFKTFNINTDRLNSSESLARRKNRSSSHRSVSTRTGAL